MKRYTLEELKNLFIVDSFIKCSPALKSLGGNRFSFNANAIDVFEIRNLTRGYSGETKRLEALLEELARKLNIKTFEDNRERIRLYIENMLRDLDTPEAERLLRDKETIDALVSEVNRRTIDLNFEEVHNLSDLYDLKFAQVSNVILQQKKNQYNEINMPIEEYTFNRDNELYNRYIDSFLKVKYALIPDNTILKDLYLKNDIVLLRKAEFNGVESIIDEYSNKYYDGQPLDKNLFTQGILRYDDSVNHQPESEQESDGFNGFDDYDEYVNSEEFDNAMSEYYRQQEINDYIQAEESMFESNIINSRNHPIPIRVSTETVHVIYNQMRQKEWFVDVPLPAEGVSEIPSDSNETVWVSIRVPESSVIDDNELLSSDFDNSVLFRIDPNVNYHVVDIVHGNDLDWQISGEDIARSFIYHKKDFNSFVIKPSDRDNIDPAESISKLEYDFENNAEFEVIDNYDVDMSAVDESEMVVDHDINEQKLYKSHQRLEQAARRKFSEADLDDELEKISRARDMQRPLFSISQVAILYQHLVEINKSIEDFNNDLESQNEKDIVIELQGDLGR